MSRIAISRSVRGRHHDANQDHQIILSTEDGRAAILQADGHGGACYTRSKMGARIACKAAAEAFSYDLPPTLWPEFIKDSFDRMAQKHLALRPLSTEEQNLLQERPPLTAYGCTFHAVVLKPGCCSTIQIGDGAVHLLDASGRFLPMAEEDPDCCGSLTSSLCFERKRALDHFRICIFDRPAACAIAFTDGYQHSGLRPLQAAQLSAKAGGPSEEEVRSLLKEGEHGDDETFAMLFDPALTAAAAYLQGIKQELLTAFLQEHCAALTAERAQLETYLQLAKGKLLGLRQQRRILEIRSFSDKVNRKMERYKKIDAELHHYKILLQHLQESRT